MEYVTAVVNMLKTALWTPTRGPRRHLGCDRRGAVAVWDMAAVLPIFQDTTIVAAGPSVQIGGLTLGALGIVANAGCWVKTPQRVCT